MIKHRASSAFSLIESAIVLALVGLVIGGIWYAAASVRENWQVEETISGVNSIVKNVQRIYSVNDSTTIGDAVSLTQASIASDIFPKDWVLSPTSVKSPFNGSSTIQNYLNPARFYVTLNNVSKSSCVKFLTRITANQKSTTTQEGYNSQNGLGWVRVHDSTGANTIATASFPITLSQASSVCDITNLIYLGYGYTRIN